MARVLVVGSGLAGLGAALESAIRGHQVVILEKRKQLGGKATSTDFDGIPVGFGPHLLLKNGPLHKLCKKLSRMKPKTSPLLAGKIDIVNHGPLKPLDDVKKSIELRRALKNNDVQNISLQAADFIASWGLKSDIRRRALLSNNLLSTNEGWQGLIGRIMLALDEVGVYLEQGRTVEKIEGKSVILADGKDTIADYVILACGLKESNRILKNSGLRGLPKIPTISASTIEVALDSYPFSGKHAEIDLEQKVAIFDMRRIAPNLTGLGSHISALKIIDDVSGEENLEQLEQFLDSRCSGWRDHIISIRKTKNVSIGVRNEHRISADLYAQNNIFLAGDWIENEHILSDAALESGRQSARLFAKAK